MNSAVTGLVLGAAVVVVIEGVQAFGTHHLRRFGWCALAGIGVAAAAAVWGIGKRHKQLAAAAAAAHEPLAHLVTGAMAVLAAAVTAVAYITATVMSRRRRRPVERWPAERW